MAVQVGVVRLAGHPYQPFGFAVVFRACHRTSRCWGVPRRDTATWGLRLSHARLSRRATLQSQGRPAKMLCVICLKQIGAL